ncbi:unnamed protein product [Rhodiola kirilowii]
MKRTRSVNTMGAPPQVYDDLEQLVRARNRANREATRQNQGAPRAQNGVGLRPPVQQQPLQQQQVPPPQPRRPPPRRRPPPQPLIKDDYDDEYDDHEPTMGELSAPNFRNQPRCIYEGPELEGIVINSVVVHHMPKFSGCQGESTTTHLQRYHGICQNLRPHGVEVEDFKRKAFYFSLIDAANDWFLSLPSGRIQTWDQMQKRFLNKYYPVGRAMQVRSQLQDLRQGPNETMYEYVEKF